MAGGGQPARRNGGQDFSAPPSIRLPVGEFGSCDWWTGYLLSFVIGEFYFHVIYCTSNICQDPTNTKTAHLSFFVLLLHLA
jgi:hypothetical protein